MTDTPVPGYVSPFATCEATIGVQVSGHDVVVVCGVENTNPHDHHTHVGQIVIPAWRRAVASISWEGPSPDPAFGPYEVRRRP